MPKLTMYGYPKCGTCRNAVKWLQQAGKEVDMIDIFQTAPSSEVLKELIAKSGLEIKKFFNVSGNVYKEMKLKDSLPGMSEEAMIDLLASNGRLIKRPIVTDGDKVTVGFKESEYETAWG